MVELTRARSSPASSIAHSAPGDGVNARSCRVDQSPRWCRRTSDERWSRWRPRTINGVELYYEMTGAGECLVLTHGSWTDGDGWGPAVDLLAERYRVVVWDRRGHSRSEAGDGPGSRAEDAADLAGLIEQVSDEPVHVAGNSYGANVTLTLLTDTARPGRHRRGPRAAAVRPPRGDARSSARQRVVGRRRRPRGRAGPDQRRATTATLRSTSSSTSPSARAWEGLPDAFRSVLEANAPTYLDELADPTALSIDTAALATTMVPLLLTHGTESPELFPAVIAELAQLVPAARVEVLEGAGHIPHVTHPQDWSARLVVFHRRECARRTSRPSDEPGPRSRRALRSGGRPDRPDGSTNDR